MERLARLVRVYDGETAACARREVPAPEALLPAILLGYPLHGPPRISSPHVVHETSFWSAAWKPMVWPHASR